MEPIASIKERRSSRWLWALRVFTIFSAMPLIGAVSVLLIAFVPKALPYISETNTQIGFALIGSTVACATLPYAMTLWGTFRMRSRRIGLLLATTTASFWFVLCMGLTLIPFLEFAFSHPLQWESLNETLPWLAVTWAVLAVPNGAVLTTSAKLYGMSGEPSRSSLTVDASTARMLKIGLLLTVTVLIVPNAVMLPAFPRPVPVSETALLGFMIIAGQIPYFLAYVGLRTVPTKLGQ